MEPMGDLNKPINLLWTGGWDSSFRLLELALVHKKMVQPYYIIDSNRRSVSNELKAMSKIKHDLNVLNPEAFTRILPTVFKEIDEIKKDVKIIGSFQSLKKTGDLSPQYEWLACYAKELGISDLEISYEKEISDPENTTRLLTSPHLNKLNTSAGEIYRLNEEIKESEVFDVYGRFHFPVYFTTKFQMQELAKKAGFFEILKHSWFCLMPVHNQPCGKCHPCRAVYLEGLKWRLPFSAKLRFHTWPLLRKITQTLGIYNRLRW